MVERQGTAANQLGDANGDERRRRDADELTTLHEITVVALESNSVDEALPLLAAKLADAFDADHCAIALWDRRAGVVSSVASSQPTTDWPFPEVPGAEAVRAVVATEHAVPCTADWLPTVGPGEEAASPVMGLPLIVRGDPIGAAFVGYDTGDAATRLDVHRAEMVTGHIALAIAHTTTVEANARRIEALIALHETGVDLAGHREIRGLLRAIVDRAGKLIGTNMGGLYLTVPNGLQMVVAKGILEPFVNRVLPVGEGASGQAVATRKAILIDDYSTWGGSSPMYEDIRVGSVIAAPLLWHDEVLGAFHVESTVPNSFGRDDVEIVSLFAEAAAVAIANARLIYNTETARKEMEQAYTATLEGWVRALDMRDEETEGHTQRVTQLSVELARRCGVTEDQLEPIRRGALLHDIGKIGIPDAILRKPGPLTDDEWKVMRRHPQMAWDMLSPIEYLRSAMAIPYGHHERWDGSGYPLGIKGRQIPLAARLFAVIDVYDALRSDRAYRSGWPEDKVIAYISEKSGTAFDPEIVEAFLTMLDETAVVE